MMNIFKFPGAKTTLNSKRWGNITAESQFLSPASDGDLVISFGNPTEIDRPLVRINSECVFAEVFASDFCDCADQLHMAMDILKEEGDGILFYLRFDGRGAGLSAKVAATELEQSGMDTFDSRNHIGVPPESRDFSKIAMYLKDRGITKIRLLTNSPDKISHLIKHGIDVQAIPIYVKEPNNHIKKLYETKTDKFGHDIPGYKKK